MLFVLLVWLAVFFYNVYLMYNFLSSEIEHYSIYGYDFAYTAQNCSIYSKDELHLISWI